MRLFCEEDDCYLYKDHSFKRAWLQGEKYKNLFITSDYIKSKGELFCVVQMVWLELDTKDIEFVVAYSRKVKKNDFTDEIDVPDNSWSLFKDKHSTARSSTPRENNYIPRNK